MYCRCSAITTFRLIADGIATLCFRWRAFSWEMRLIKVSVHGEVSSMRLKSPPEVPISWVADWTRLELPGTLNRRTLRCPRPAHHWGVARRTTIKNCRQYAWPEFQFRRLILQAQNKNTSVNVERQQVELEHNSQILNEVSCLEHRILLFIWSSIKKHSDTRHPDSPVTNATNLSSPSHLMSSVLMLERWGF